MRQDVTTTPTTSSSSMVSRKAVEARIEEFHGRLVESPGRPNSFLVSRAMAPTTRERRQLSAVGERLAAELEPRDEAWTDEKGREWTTRTALEVVISRLLLGFDKGRGQSEANTALLNGEYLDALRVPPGDASCPYLPIWAVEQAAQRIRSNTTLIKRKLGFRPDPNEFVAEVREGMVEPKRKLRRLRRVLEATVIPDPPTQAERDAVAAAMAKFAEGIRQMDEHDPDLPRRYPPAPHRDVLEPVPPDAVLMEHRILPGQLSELGRLTSNLDRRGAAT